MTSAGAGALWLCETVTAGPLTPKHLRRLAATGPHPGGGADTPSLCGVTVSWDVHEFRPPADADPMWTCRACMEAVHLVFVD